MTDESRLEAAAALRALNNAFVAHDADEELLDRITTIAREIVADLRSAPERDLSPLLRAHAGRMFRVGPTDESQQSSVNPMIDRAVGGQGNPISADLDFEYDEDEVLVRTVLDAAYEGAPGRAHGGMVAALFDEVMGFLLPLAGTAAYTGQLIVRYHKPVPIGRLLEFHARFGSRDGRKLHVTADCQTDDELVASAESLFITVDIARFGTSPG